MSLCSGKLEAFAELLVRCHMCVFPESLVLLRIMGWDVARGPGRILQLPEGLGGSSDCVSRKDSPK